MLPKDIDLFLCHNSADKDWTRNLGARLENERLGDHGLKVFFDEWDIDIGDNFVLKINDALLRSRFMAIVISPEMLSSAWCRLEFTAALSVDPSNRLMPILPLWLRDKHAVTGQRMSLPPILSPFNFIDFRRKEDHARGLTRLLARVRGDPPPRDGTARRHAATDTAWDDIGEVAVERDAPDFVSETLVSNLLPIKQLPETIWSSPTRLVRKDELPEGSQLPPFILKENRAYSFHDLTAPDWKAVCPTAERTEHRRSDWRRDDSRWRWYIELLNLTLKEYLSARRVWFHRDTKRFFFASTKGRGFKLRWGDGTRRQVVRAPDDEGGRWIHHAAYLRFESIGQDLYLSVAPCWHFTVDGKTPVPSEEVVTLAARWGGRERNGAIFRNVLLWSDLLANFRKEALIPAGKQALVIGRLPAKARSPVGIATDRTEIGALFRFQEAELEMELGNTLDLGFLDEDEAPLTENEEAQAGESSDEI